MEGVELNDRGQSNSKNKGGGREILDSYWRIEKVITIQDWPNLEKSKSSVYIINC